MYRAVKIWNPTTELTGVFKCRVSSFHNEDFASRKMIVYSPEDSMNMTFVKNKKKAVTFYCSAIGVYPKPTMQLLLLNEKQKRVIKPTRLETELEPKGSYNISLEALVKDKNLPKEALMQCILRIPGTGHGERRQLVYFPDYSYHGFDGDGSSLACCSFKLIVVSLTFLFYPSYHWFFSCHYRQ